MMNRMNRTPVKKPYPPGFPNSNFSRQSLLPAEFFRTPGKHYVFDVNHVCFLEVNEVVYKIISLLTQAPKDYHELVEILDGHSPQDIREGLDEIAQIQDQGYLKLYNFKRELPAMLSNENIEILNNKLRSLYLNITSKCNLSCSYCIFGGQYEQHGELQQQEMTWEIAQNAIDFFLKRARKNEPLRVDFFGGEPLLAFPLIQRVVAVLKEKILQRNQELVISISSNGTVMNDKIAGFLIENDVHFQISLDGDKRLQDAKRKFKGCNGGSFDTILKNLRLLFDHSPEYYKTKLRLKAVISTDSLDYDGMDFLNVPLIKKIVELKRFSVLNQTPHYDIEKDRDFFARMHKLGEALLGIKDVSNRDELMNALTLKQNYLFKMTFIEFFRIQVHNSLHFEIDQPIPFMKSCLSGYEGCVNVDGSISICYKSGSFNIGNVIEDTWYYDKIEEFHKKRHTLPECKYCYLQRSCTLCYEAINGKEDQLEDSIKKYCKFQRRFYRVIFEYMLQVMENNPLLWDDLEAAAEEEHLKRKSLEDNSDASN